MTHFPPNSSQYKRSWVKDLPAKYCDEWEQLGLVNPPIKKDGTVVRSVPFYAAQQLHRLNKVPRQLRGSTKPVVVTTSKIGEPFYTPQLDFDLRTTQAPPLTYNNLLDPHLKHFFNNPSKRRVLEKRGFITREGDVICHSMKELNQYREMLYSNHQEMLKVLRTDINAYLPKILAKRKAIAEITSERRRYNLLRNERSGSTRQSKKSSYNKQSQQSKGSRKPVKKKSSYYGDSSKSSSNTKVESRRSSMKKSSKIPVGASVEEVEAATKIQACFRGYMIRKKLALAYQRNLKKELKKRGGSSARKKKIWEKTNHDLISTCHTHSCTENLSRQFIITDLPSMMKFLKDPVSQQAYRKNYLLRLMHTPCMDISGTMVKPLLRDEIKRRSSKFRWV